MDHSRRHGPVGCGCTAIAHDTSASPLCRTCRFARDRRSTSSTRTPAPAESYVRDVRLRPARHARPLSRVRGLSDGGKAVRRIGRYILNGLTVISLVLCVATVGLWVRSYHAGPG